MGRAAELLDGSAGHIHGALEQQRGRGQLGRELPFLPPRGSLRSAAAVEAEPSVLTSSSVASQSLCVSAGAGEWQEISEHLLECWLREGN